MAKRDDAAAVKWLLDHGADPTRAGPLGRRGDAAASRGMQGHVEVVRLLLAPAPMSGSATASTTARRSTGRGTSDSPRRSRYSKVTSVTTSASDRPLRKIGYHAEARRSAGGHVSKRIRSSPAMAARVSRPGSRCSAFRKLATTPTSRLPRSAVFDPVMHGSSRVGTPTRRVREYAIEADLAFDEVIVDDYEAVLCIGGQCAGVSAKRQKARARNPSPLRGPWTMALFDLPWHPADRGGRSCQRQTVHVLRARARRGRGVRGTIRVVRRGPRWPPGVVADMARTSGVL